MDHYIEALSAEAIDRVACEFDLDRSHKGEDAAGREIAVLRAQVRDLQSLSGR